MTALGAPELALHAVRVLGASTARRAAGLYGLPDEVAEDALLDAEARGLASRYRLTGPDTWSVTDRGRAADEAWCAAELARTGGGAPLRQRYDEVFLPLNRRLTQACTRWQLRPLPGDPLAANDHTDWGWDSAVLDELLAVGRRLDSLSDELAAVLPRLSVHAPRFRDAVAKANAGDGAWVDAPGRDSCHIVWIQLHEDLLVTLGLDRAS